MTTLDAPARRKRGFWADARFFLGVVLIAASIAGVWFVIALAKQTTPVLAAVSTIVPGEVVSAEQLRIVDVALGAARDAYLAPDALAHGAVATRTIRAGELVPVSALGAAEAARTTRVVVRSSTDVPASVTAGSTVEVWAAPRAEQGRFGAPVIVVADAVVVSVHRDDGMLGRKAASLELVIPRADVAATLTAIAAESALSVVPTVDGGR